jgi:hypothetical protein
MSERIDRRHLEKARRRQRETLNKANGANEGGDKKHPAEHSLAAFGQNDHRTSNSGENQSNNQDIDSEHRDNERSMRNSTMAIAGLTGVLALVGFISSVFSGLQWVAIKGQWKEMHDAGADSKKLIDANVKLSAAAQQYADTANKNLVATQRAWVGPTDASIVKSADYTIVKGAASYVNSGHEPAKMNVWGKEFTYSRDNWEHGKASSEIEARKNECLAIPSITGARFAWPTSGFNAYTVHFPDGQIPQNGVAVWTPEIDNGSAIVVLQGCIAYEAFNEIHRSAFCYFYDSKMSDIAHLNVCNVGNEIN